MIKKISLSTLLMLLVIVAKSQAIDYRFSFLGKYDFTMIGNTMNEFPNGGGGAYCDFLTQTSATLNLSAGQNIEAAYLYWAGSGSLTQADLDIKLNGNTVSVDRTFTVTMGSSPARPTFGAFSDVTALVRATGNGIYTVSDFDLSAVIPPYCSTGGNFGGWSILIVYEDATLSNNLVNIYDGFTRLDRNDPNVAIQLNNLNVLHLVGNKIAFLSWEGDVGNSQDEELRINGTLVSNPPLNPADNVFNGTNSFTGSDELYNMDMDYFNINDLTNIGDNSLLIELQTGGSFSTFSDAVILNNIVVVLNSEVADATIEIQHAIGDCDDRDISIDYTVSNLIATDILPAGTPIAFYADTTLVGTSATVSDIAIGGTETGGTITITIPDTIPVNFDLIAKVDDDGTGNGIVIEFNENNNTDQQQIRLRFTPVFNEPQPLVLCDANDDGEVLFDLDIAGQQIIGGQNFVNIRYYESMTAAQNGTPFITTPNSYPNTSPTQTIYARLDDGTGCFIIDDFTIQITPPQNLAYTIPDMISCIDGPNETGIITDLTTQNNFVLNGANPTDYTISYHLSEAGARQGNAIINTPTNYPNIQSPQTIWVRMIDNQGCVQVGSFILEYNLNPVVSNQIFENCSFSEYTTYNLPDINDEIVANVTGLDFSYHLTHLEAENDENPLPLNYNNTSPDQVIFVRVETADGCYSISEVTLTTLILHEEIQNLFQQCDDPTRINDEKSTFDLTTMNPDITNALGGTNFTITYHTSIENAQVGTGAIQNPTEFMNTSNPQSIYARATSSDGSCGGTAEFEVEVLRVPEFEMPPYIAFCEDEERIYQFEENFVTYTWRDAEGNVVGNSAMVEFQNEGMHTLEVTSNVNACPAIRKVEVIFDHSATIMDIKVDGNTVSVFPAGGEAPYQYSYNNGLTWHDYFILDNVPSGVHSMLVKTKYGCISEAKLFGVLGIPNLITPNGDGYNDYWEIRALEMYPDATIKIFDRYGKMFMDRKMQTNFRWDGKYLGNPLPSGSYWYIITIEEGKSISGHITIRNR
ncbi:T9SS type B sorting domain-containing protein [Moheibacter sediminis]|uniref:Gliding motility-associated C-terminal domain-containing protein n=1 Tax=Moheibacter sediminis TaxID=1434700 RepID=A0A1W1ZAE2_9FLAO|nr:T9SS type B sorting domain-containing protein [Moheibacter sediminis]SMC45379.1 gliding motility-associated C-terminal domain-containing protein [Moheibacter sediminis]